MTRKCEMRTAAEWAQDWWSMQERGHMRSDLIEVIRCVQSEAFTAGVEVMRDRALNLVAMAQDMGHFTGTGFVITGDLAESIRKIVIPSPAPIEGESKP